MMPSGMPMSNATVSAITPSWAEMGRLARNTSLTVRLRECIDGPKFIQRNQATSPILTLIRKSSISEVVGATVVMRGTMVLYR